MTRVRGMEEQIQLKPRIVNCESTCIDYISWSIVDDRAESCRDCKELMAMIMSAGLVSKVMEISKEKLGKGQPVQFVIVPVLKVEYDEHGNLVSKDVEGTELFIMSLGLGGFEYVRIGRIK